MDPTTEVTQSKSPYHGEVLGANTIRLLSISLPNPEASTLHLTASLYELDKLIEYDAISYVWGTEEASVTIPCNDGFLQITPRAYEMLEHLRLYRPFPNRLLWIDAICINQVDMDEKAVQIPLMSQIYSKSKSVVVWFGPSIPETLAFMADFDRVKLIGREWVALNSQNRDPYVEGQALPSEDDPFWGGLFYLLNSEWFRRLWTFQEVILAPRGVIMLCGSSQVDLEEYIKFSADNFQKFGGYISTASLPASRVPGLPRWADLAWSQCWTIQLHREQIKNGGRCLDPVRIPFLIHRLRSSRVKEAVDRVWAISALLGQDLQQKLAPLVDYSDEGRTKYYETYARATKVVIEHSQSLDLLTIPPSVEVDEALPSWCPNLSGESACKMLITGMWNIPADSTDQEQKSALTAEDDKEACYLRRRAILHHSQKLISFTNDGMLLCVRGFVVDTISEVIEDRLLLGYRDNEEDPDLMSLDNPIHAAAISFFARAPELARKTISSTEGLAGDSTSIVPEYLMALFIDNRINLQLDTVYTDTVSLFTSSDWSRYHCLDISKQNHMLDCLSRLKGMIGHSFFATKGGRFGIAHPGCKPGDKVCVFYGSQPLHILRFPEDQTPANRGHAKFCGVAFIPRFMEQYQWDAAKQSDNEIFEIA